MIEILLCCIGFMMHNLSILMEMSEKMGRKITFVKYLNLRPYKAIFAAMCSIVAFTIATKAGDMNTTTAFLCGMFGSDIIDWMGKVPKNNG